MKKKYCFQEFCWLSKFCWGMPSSVFWGEIFLCSPLTRRQELYIEMQLESRLLPLTFSRNKVGMPFVYGFC